MRLRDSEIDWATRKMKAKHSHLAIVMEIHYWTETETNWD